MQNESVTDVRTEIINAAKEVIQERGVIRAEMKDIAAKANISRATLYRYFSSKEAILFVLANRGVKLIFSATFIPEEVIVNLETGFDKVEWQVQSLVRRMFQHPEYVMFLRDFDVFYTQAYPTVQESLDYEHAIQSGSYAKEVLKNLYEGMDDGSIRMLDNPELTVKSMLNSCFAMGQRIIPREEHYILENGYGKEQVNVLARMLVGYLKNPCR